MKRETKIQALIVMTFDAQASEAVNREIIHECLSEMQERLMLANNVETMTCLRDIQFKAGRRHIPKPVKA